VRLGLVLVPGGDPSNRVLQDRHLVAAPSWDLSWASLLCGIQKRGRCEDTNENTHPGGLVRCCAGTLLALLACAIVADTPKSELTREHVDLRMVYQPESTNLLTLLVHDGDLNRVYAPDEIILVVAEEARLELPPGTPFGAAGDPLWILPQSQDPNLLYLGTDAGAVPQDVFSDALTLQLKNVQGPGHFYLWQAGEVGGLNVRMNSANGITEEDRITPVAGSHEHFNWGFSTSGVYQLTFQLSGMRIGEITNISSPETVFTFHVLPLPDRSPFELWQQLHWPDGAPDDIQGPDADPDGDGILNVIEYALGLDPLGTSVEGLPEFIAVLVNDNEYGAIRFNRRKAATDLTYETLVGDRVDGSWDPLTEIHETNGPRRIGNNRGSRFSAAGRNAHAILSVAHSPSRRLSDNRPTNLLLAPP
jgi:surface-anchored protein